MSVILVVQAVDQDHHQARHAEDGRHGDKEEDQLPERVYRRER